MFKLNNFKYLVIGIIIGGLLSVPMVQAANTVKLVVNGEDITYKSDVPPQIIDGRTLVPARALAESLGATVEWDEGNKSVIVTNNTKQIIDSVNIQDNIKEYSTDITQELNFNEYFTNDKIEIALCEPEYVNLLDEKFFNCKIKLQNLTDIQLANKSLQIIYIMKNGNEIISNVIFGINSNNYIKEMPLSIREDDKRAVKSINIKFTEFDVDAIWHIN